MNIVKYTTKIGAIIMIAIGMMMYSGYFSIISPNYTDNYADEGDINSENVKEEQIIPAKSFNLEDQYGNIHKLEDYEGKIIFLNFWATWCPPCKAEMPDIQKLYEEYHSISSLPTLLCRL